MNDVLIPFSSFIFRVLEVYKLVHHTFRTDLNTTKPLVTVVLFVKPMLFSQ